MTECTTLQVFYTDTFALPLFPNSRFPLDKYRSLRARLQSSEMSDRLIFRTPEAATDDQLLLVHTIEYLTKLRQGSLSLDEQRQIGFPWSLEMVERSRRSTGGTIAAASAAMVDGQAVHLAGGTHHAFADHGQGYCVFNDVAVAIRVLQAERRLKRAVVVDLDVHQGNGTAAVFASDPNVFTFSIHGEGNFPAEKRASDLDIPLPNGIEDDDYLAILSEAIENFLPLSGASAVFYLAGADPYAGDRFGKLNLSKAGLVERDKLVFAACRKRSLPLTVVLAGGYARTVDDIVDIHAATVMALL